MLTELTRSHRLQTRHVLNRGLLMTKAYLFAGIAASAMLAASSAFATNLVSDGDFNNPSGGGSFTDYLSGTSFGPWTVTGTGSGPYGSAGVDLIGGYWQAPTLGGGSVDLDGLAPGGIEQTINGLSAGKQYTLYFYLSGNPDGSPTTKTVDVSIGSLDHVLTYTLNGSSSESDMQYEEIRAQFIAGSSNVLSFSSLDSNGSPFGPVVGGVSISAPEPSTWAMMLAGFAGLGFLGFRRSRQPVAITV